MTTVGDSARIYEDLGVQPVINAAGAYTVLGGSTLSPAVQAAMAEANGAFVEMRSLLASSGRIIAGLLGAEAAYVTSGGAAALALAAAACMTGDDAEKMERLPDSTGMKSDIIIQAGLRSKYDRCVTVPGSRLLEIGDRRSVSQQQLADAIGPNTAAIHFLAPGEVPGCLPLAGVIEIAHAADVPVIVDAAGQTYPVDNLRKYTRMGADLVCYAAKYFDAPHSTGLVVGRRDLVAAAAMNSFIGFEALGIRTIGRPMKVDRQEIVALVVALREWLAMNHEERFLKYSTRVDVLLRELRSLAGVEVSRISQLEQKLPDLNYAVIREGVQLLIDPGRAGVSAEQVVQRLKDGTPSIWTIGADNTITVSVAFFQDGEETIVAQRIRAAISG